MGDKLTEEVSARYYEAPFICDLGMELVKVEPGLAESVINVAENHLQQDGFVHAGVVATLADHTGGAAAWTLVKASQTVLTIEFKIQFLNPARGPRLSCTARVLRPGGRITSVEAEVTNPDGSMAAKLTMTLAIVEKAKLK